MLHVDKQDEGLASKLMGFSDFWLQSKNGKKISLDNLKELKKSDLQGNATLIRIFNIFDTQNADGTRGADGVLNKEELTSLFNTISSVAKLKGNTSIFEVEEAEDYINTTQTSEGKTLKELGVKASDLFNFISQLVPQNNNPMSTFSGIDILSQSYTPEEIEDLSIQTVIDDVERARQIFNSQDKNQGVVSDFVNGTKETFDTEFAASRVNRYVMREELCVDLLAQSKSENGLSEKEYLEAKINLAVSMLPKLKNSSLKSSIVKNIISLGLYRGFGNKTKAEQERIAEEMEIELLKDALRKLKPEDLRLFIQEVTAMPDAEYTEKAAQVVENMINQSLQEKIRDNQIPMADTNQVIIKHQPIPGSIEYIEQHSDAYKKMTFEETFEAERGVQYNPKNIMDYTEKNAKMQFLLGMHNKRQQIYNILHDATVTVDGNNKYGAPNTRAIKPCEEQLESAILLALTNLYGDNPEKMQEALDKLGIPNLKIIKNASENDVLNPMKLCFDYGEESNQNSAFKINRELNGYDLVEIANKLQGMVDANYETALGDKTLEEYGQEVNSAYQIAYGARNAQHMAEAFAESQQEGVQTVKTAVQIGGMIVMVAGQLVPVGGQVATAMIYGGLATSAVGGVGISALENYTKAGGPTEEDKKEMLKELGISLALVGSGMGIGKTSEAAFRALVLKNCPKLLAFASEVGIDATMSIVADYAITGQIDLSGEGIAQLQAILVGILHAKGNFKTYINTHAEDLTVKPRTDETASPVSRVAQKPVSDIPSPTVKSNDNNIPTLSQAEINRLKASDPSIRQMADGTIIKADNTGKPTVIGIINKTVKGNFPSETLTKHLNDIHDSEIPKSMQSDWNKCKSKIEMIMQRINDGLIEFDKMTNDLINNIGNELKVIYQKASGSLKNKIEIIIREFNNFIEKTRNKLNQYDSYENKLSILSNIKDSNGNIRYSKDYIDSVIKANEEIPTKTLYALLSLGDYDTSFEITNILKNIKSPEDIRTLSLLTESDKYSIKNKNISHRHLDEKFDIHDIENIFEIKVKSNIKDFDNVLKTLLDTDVASLVNSKGSSVTIMSFLSHTKNENQKAALLLIVDKLKNNVPQLYIDRWDVAKILDNIENEFDFELFKTLIFKNDSQKQAMLQVMWTYAKVTKSQLNSDAPVMNFIRENKKIPYDAIEINKIIPNNDLEKQALELLIDVNETGRFEALAIKDIIENIKTGNDLIRLKSALQNKNLDTHTIIQMMKDPENRGMLEFKLQDEVTQQKNYSQSNETPPIKSRKISETYQRKLQRLKEASPKRYQRIVDSGLLDLIEAGKIDSSILKNIDENTFLSNRTLNDIRKIRDGEPLIKTLSSPSDLIDISRHVPNGDVCELNGKLYVNDNGTATEIKLSKEKFEELFPPLSRVAFEQQGLGDCYLVTTLDNCMDLPSGRTALYKLFEQQGNDILIRFPNSDKAVKFENGKVINVGSKQVGGTSKSEVAPGIQMIEQAYAVHRLDRGSRAYNENSPITEISKLSNVEELMNRLTGGWQYDVVKDIFGKDITFNHYGTNLENRERMKNRIISTANDPNTLTFFGTRSECNGGIETAIASQYDIYSDHSYSIKGYDEATGMVYITNPWHTSVITEIPIYELMKYISDVNIANINN